MFIETFIADLDIIATKEPKVAKPTCQAGRLPWIKPPQSFAKCNVDGAVSRHGNRGVIAAVCRDENGAYLGSSYVTFSSIIDAPILKALACREALALADDLMIRRILVSSDCTSVIKDLMENSGGHYSAVVKEINV